MKKILFLLFLCSFLVLSLASCSLFDDGHEKPTVLWQESDELIATLVDYLHSFLTSYDMPDTSLAIKIDDIKDGKQPLLLEFDPSDFYYVCGYYKGTPENESPEYRHTSDYLWLRYEKAEDIREKYRGRTCIAAFRINPAAKVSDIRSENAKVPTFEHFAMFDPSFKNGYHTGETVGFNERFIYLNAASDKKTVYYTTSAYNHNWITIPCIKLDGELYIETPIYRIRSDGERQNSDLEWEFGKYYDTLMRIMITDKYSVTLEQGTRYYGLFLINEFVESVLNERR